MGKLQDSLNRIYLFEETEKTPLQKLQDENIRRREEVNTKNDNLKSKQELRSAAGILLSPWLKMPGRALGGSIGTNNSLAMTNRALQRSDKYANKYDISQLDK